MSILNVEGLTAGYGAHDVLFDISLKIWQGEIICVIGPNGAGKSTLLKSIAGIIKPTRGQIIFKGENITWEAPQRIAAKGISWVPQEENIFPSMTVRENLEMGAFLLRGDLKERISEVCEIFNQLAERMGQFAGSLSGGQRQMLALARGLMTHPQLLLLDEPTSGLAPKLVHLMLDKIKEIAERLRNSVLLVTQTMDAVRLSDRGYLLSAGIMRYQGRTEELLSNSEVQQLYFGNRLPVK
ncbi:MAG: ABC transporter ATP-binding protein [Spirochaetota bacterium]